MNIGALLLAILSGFSLTEIYRVIKSEWPLLYVNFTSVVDPIQRRSLLRWVLFRSCPAFVASAYTAVTVGRWGHTVSGYLLALVGVHIVSMYSVPLVDGVKKQNLRSQQVLLWATSAFLVSVAAIAACLLRKYLEPFVPKPTEMVGVVWTGLFAGSFFAIVKTRLQFDDGVLTQELIERSKEEIKIEFGQEIDRLSSKYFSDAVLITSIAVVENIQRPAWLRKIEFQLGRIRRRGTYGIMQISSAKPMTDGQSIEVSTRDYFSNTIGAPGERVEERFDRLLELACRHNTNPVFLEMFEEVLSGLLEWDV